jgi:hypothetical protein
MIKKRLFTIFTLFNLQLTLWAQTTVNENDTTEQLPTAAEQRITSALDAITEQNKFVDFLTMEDLYHLPVALKKTIGNTTYAIGIDSANFKSDGAYFNAFIAVKLPNTTRPICFEVRQIKFNPAGVTGGNQSRLVLVAAPKIKINKNVYLELNDKGGNYISWNCSGFQSVSFNGGFVFQRSLFLADSSVTTKKTVDAEFLVNATDINDIVVQTTVTPFCIKGFKGLGFNVTNLILDFSDVQNGIGMPIPPEASSYPNPNNWTGFYLKQIAVRYSSEFNNKSAPIMISANDMFIDKYGFTGTLTASNILPKKDGNVGGWGISIDQFSLIFYKSNLTGGGLGGQIEVPINSQNQSFTYNALINYNPINEDLDYALTLRNDTAIEVNALGAKIDIFPNSSLSFVRLNGGKIKPTLVLNGEVKFNNKLTTPKLAFQSLTIITQKPYITNGIIALAGDSLSCKLKGFEIYISNIALTIDSVNPRIDMTAGMKLSGGNGDNTFKLGVAVSFHINFEYQTNTELNSEYTSVSRSKLKLKNVGIDAISLDITTKVFQFKGLIVLYENHPTYGDGFFGQIQLSIDKVFPSPLQITARFGRIPATVATPSYKYWYADIYVPVKIPLGANFYLSKIIGGAYHHMLPANATKATCINLVKGPAPQAEAQTYVPSYTSGLGIKLGAGFYYTDQTLVCGDAMLEVAFSTSGGLSLIKLDANAYAITKKGAIPSLTTSIITASATISWNNVTKTFHLGALANVNAQGIITGQANINFQVSATAWYFTIGTPSQRCNLNINTPLYTIASTVYFQAGDSIDVMQSLPAPFNQYFNINSVPANGGTLVNTGAGFAFGVTSNIDVELKALCAAVNVGMGFLIDVNLLKYPAGTVCAQDGSSFGTNGWYAEGVFCIYGTASVNVCGVNFCSGSIAALLQGAGPNPFYVKGELDLTVSILGASVNTTFKAKYGDECTPSTGADTSVSN